MDEPSETGQNDDPSSNQAPPSDIITIDPRGDVLLDVTFETSKATLKATRKATPKPRPGQRIPPPPQPILRPEINLAFRVDLATLTSQSRYFTNLLADTRFQEARAIATRHADLTRAGTAPADAPADQLPRVYIIDDDEATRSAGRPEIFGDMLRLLHDLDTKTSRTVTMIYVSTLAVMADRFACTAAVGRYLTTRLKFRWPATPAPRLREDGTLSSLSAAAEQLVRQKVLVSWLLDWPIRFGAATREMVWYGSTRWTEQYAEDEDEEQEADTDAAGEPVWWYLADELEEELHTRRVALLTTLASIPNHFLHLYTHRTRNGLRQCALGYDNSSACDSFQLGEMVKFLVSKSLLSLTTFAPALSQSSLPVDFAAVDLHSILAALKKCPTYQIDRNHTNCGLRTRIGPVIEYVMGMLSAGSLQISLVGWKKERRETSWAKKPTAAEADAHASGSTNKREFVVGNDEDGGPFKPSKGRIFRFTRAVATDQRLRYEGALAAEMMARDLFTADGWDWTPEDVDKVPDVEGWRLSTSMPHRRK